MMFGHLCGGPALTFILVSQIEQNVNTAKWRLLPSNDVEQNPGPVRYFTTFILIVFSNDGISCICLQNQEQNN